MQALGSKGRLIIQEESTFKVSPAADAQLVYFKNESLRLSRNLISSETIRSNRNPSKPVRGNVDVSGDIVVELQAYMTKFLKWSFGSVSTTGASAPYTHTFTIGGTLPSFLAEKGFTDINQYHLYNGCKVNSMSVSLTPEGFQDVTFNILGAKETVSGSSYDSTATDLGKQSFDGFAVATIEEGGSAIAYVTAVDNLSIENNLDGNSYVIGGAGERRWLPEGLVKVSGTLRALFESQALYTKAIAHTESSLKVVYQIGTGAGTAGNEYLEIYIPELVYQPTAPVISGPTGIVVELPFEAFYENDGGASALKAIVKNTTAIA